MGYPTEHDLALALSLAQFETEKVSGRIAWGKDEGARRVVPSGMRTGLRVNRGVLGE